MMVKGRRNFERKLHPNQIGWSKFIKYPALSKWQYHSLKNRN